MVIFRPDVLPASHCRVTQVLHGKDEMNILLVIDATKDS